MCNPTARSPELLVLMLGIYPILESLLSASHRSGITHLAQTSKTVRKILTSDVPRLLTLFRSCKRMRLCDMCNTVVCNDCVATTWETEKRGLRWGDRDYALVGGHTEALRQEIVSKLQSMRSYFESQESFHCTPCNFLYCCEACYSQARRKPREWMTPAMEELEFFGIDHMHDRFTVCFTLKAKHIPHIKRACACNGFEAGCKASPHLVPMDSLPIGSELAGMLWYSQLSRHLRFELAGVPYDKRNRVPFYLLPQPGPADSSRAH